MVRAHGYRIYCPGYTHHWIALAFAAYHTRLHLDGYHYYYLSRFALLPVAHVLRFSLHVCVFCTVCVGSSFTHVCTFDCLTRLFDFTFLSPFVYVYTLLSCIRVLVHVPFVLLALFVHFLSLRCIHVAMLFVFLRVHAFHTAPHRSWFVCSSDGCAFCGSFSLPRTERAVSLCYSRGSHFPGSATRTNTFLRFCRGSVLCSIRTPPFCAFTRRLPRLQASRFAVTRYLSFTHTFGSWLGYARYTRSVFSRFCRYAVLGSRTRCFRTRFTAYAPAFPACLPRTCAARVQRFLHSAPATFTAPCALTRAYAVLSTSLTFYTFHRLLHTSLHLLLLVATPHGSTLLVYRLAWRTHSSPLPTPRCFSYSARGCTASHNSRWIKVCSGRGFTFLLVASLRTVCTGSFWIFF